jgi:hypothetical protein
MISIYFLGLDLEMVDEKMFEMITSGFWSGASLRGNKIVEILGS